MKSNKLIQISFIILMIESSLALIYGFLAFIMPEILASHSFFLYTGQTWESLLVDSPNIANYILVLEGAAGGMGITAILANLFVLLTSFRKGEKWAWFFILVVSIVGWGTNLITNILLKNTLPVIIMASGIILLIVALSISARAFLAEKINV